MSAPTSETRALYESMPTLELLELRKAFKMDVATADPSFLWQRLALINEILDARKSRNDRETPLDSK